MFPIPVTITLAFGPAQLSGSQGTSFEATCGGGAAGLYPCSKVAFST